MLVSDLVNNENDAEQNNGNNDDDRSCIYHRTITSPLDTLGRFPRNLDFCVMVS